MENKNHNNKEFWNSLLTEKSWKILHKIKHKYNFILIGGWAVYLLTKQQKSKDIDVVIDLTELKKFDKNELRKNDNLKKYEIKNEEIDIDIYLEYYSKLVIPVEDIKNYSIEVEGFRVLCPEALLILKHSAYLDRINSVKGEKDKIDIASLVFFSEINFKRYDEILKKYKLDYFKDLEKLIKNFKEYDSLNLNPREFKLRKNKILNEMRVLI